MAAEGRKSWNSRPLACREAPILRRVFDPLHPARDLMKGDLMHLWGNVGKTQ
jgi:hypothetical protein